MYDGHNKLGLRGVIGKFFWGGRVIFPDFFPGMKCFFPVENFHFVDPKQIWVVWKSEKQKKKKKRFSPHFFNFSTTFHLQFSTFPFTIFFLFSIFTLFPLFLASFFPVGQQKFPGQKSLGALCPLPPPVTTLLGLLAFSDHNPLISAHAFFSGYLL